VAATCARPPLQIWQSARLLRRRAPRAPADRARFAHAHGGHMSCIRPVALHVKGRSSMTHAPATSSLPANDRTPRPTSLTLAGDSPMGLRLPLHPRRIIAAVDFSPGGERARAVAEALARSSDAVLDLVHVLDAFDHIFVRRQPELLDDADAVLAGVDRALDSRARTARLSGVRCVSSSLVGAPGIELSRHAVRTRADLMVVGAAAKRGDWFRSGWGGRAIQQLLRLAHWPGVIVQVSP
jgi:nucleotide-binding universal stress UspA family protein